MQVRRVVAGVDAAGKTAILSDGPAPHGRDFESVPGQNQTRIWFSEGVPSTSAPEAEPTLPQGPVVPGPGGSSFVVLRFPPDSVMEDESFDPSRAAAEFKAFAPDIDAADSDVPGVHRTASVDYVIVLEGEVWLEVSDGVSTRLSAGDTVVQLAGHHAWRNKTDANATVAVVLTGAHES
jgi:hypothetical protein